MRFQTLVELEVIFSSGENRLIHRLDIETCTRYIGSWWDCWTLALALRWQQMISSPSIDDLHWVQAFRSTCIMIQGYACAISAGQEGRAWEKGCNNGRKDISRTHCCYVNHLTFPAQPCCHHWRYCLPCPPLCNRAQPKPHRMAPGSSGSVYTCFRCHWTLL